MPADTAPDVLIEALRFATDRRGIDEAMSQFSCAYGFRWFSYLSVNGAEVSGISNYPSRWQALYLASNLASVDPVVEAVPLHRGGFLWSDSKPPVRPTREHRSFFDKARAFGIRSGMTIPVFDGFGRRAIVTFSGEDPSPNPGLLERGRFDALSLAAYLDAIVRLRNQGVIVLSGGPCPLTPYQLECLSWVSYGKSIDDIAALRGVTRRAIEFQMDAIRRKLDAMTTSQAMAIALRQRWIL